MNIFILDEDPIKAASYLCDRHVVKMPVESAQMLSAVAFRYGFDPLYKPTYKNHPCTLWAGETYENWLWLVQHGLAIGREFNKRYGKVHKSALVIEYYFKNNYGPSKTNLKRTDFVLAVPNHYKIKDDAVKSYRNYYISDKKTFKDGKPATWKEPSVKPDWWPYQ